MAQSPPGVLVSGVPVSEDPVSEVDPPAGVRPSAAAAWRQMRDLSHHPDVLRRTHALAVEFGLTPGVTKALVHLSADHPTPMRELAVALRCDNSYVTAVVDGLEERGMARRRPHPTDRRIKVIELTDQGAVVASRARTALDEPPPSFAGLSAEESDLLLSLMTKLTAG